MFIDTSAFIAIFLREAEANILAIAIQNADRRLTSPLVRLETCMVLSTRCDMTPVEAQRIFDGFIAEADIVVMDIDDDVGVVAVDAFERYGKGRRNKASLNLADCMSYACAHTHQLPILFVGKDFTRTDLKPALRQQ